ncbi:MAG: hypothetical protein KDE19_14365, partial [Caldilineaceae bacterium]|nr:hypothetical protein [Caldilineaceae bacterium]
GWRLSFLDDNFPNRNVQRILVFAAENLAPPYFTATAAGELTLLTPDYAVEPMAALNGKVANAPLADVALLSALANGFGRHLADVDTRGLQHEVDARLHAADLSLLSTAELLDLYQFSAQPLREQAYRAFIGRLTAVLDQPLTDQLGVPKLQLIGYSVEQGGAEQSPVLALYAEVLAPLDWDYTIWLHAFTDSGKSTLDFSPMQPSTSWFPGQVVRLQRTLALAPGTYDLQLGLWRSEEDVRLVLPAGDIGVSLGAVTVP